MKAQRVQAMGTDSPAVDDPRWEAVVGRDATADGTFYYSVETTGVYCRPSCGARRPLRQHVRFHLTREDANRAGYRPCRRCQPDQPPLAERHAATVAGACRLIEQAAQPPSLARLAQQAGLSRYHFHRVFRALTGVTPADYAAAHRAQRLRRSLREDRRTVTDAVYAAGFNSSGRFYDAADQVLGMTPRAFRQGGVDTTIYFAVGETSLGSVLVAQSVRGVCAIMLGDEPDGLVQALENQFPRAALLGGDTAFEHTVATVLACVEAPGIGLALPLDVRGTAFQHRVWNALRDIPIGSTATYSDIAARIGAPKSVRAVAQACAANPLAVAIPCHRVIRRDGALAGYRWGIERKGTLLAREGVVRSLRSYR